MSRLVCRFGLICTAWCLLGAPASGQVLFRTNPVVEEPPEPFLAPRHDLVYAFTQAGEQMAAGQYAEALSNLQRVLDEPEDHFLADDAVQGPDAGEAGLTTLKQAVRQRLAQLPPDARRTYETQQGLAIREALNAALNRDDVRAVQDLVRQAPSTAEGILGRSWLADRAYDEGRFLEAARGYRELLELDLPADRRTVLGARSAIAEWQAGRRDIAARVIRSVQTESAGRPLRLAGREVGWFDVPERATEWLQQIAPYSARSAHPLTTWPQFLGAADRNGVAAEVTSTGGVRWQLSTLQHLKLDVDAQRREEFRDLLQQQIGAVADNLRAQRLTAIPAPQPLVTDERIIYRTLNDVTAVDAASGRLLWRSILANPQLRQFSRSAEEDSLLGEAALTRAAAEVEPVLKARLYQDSAAGVLSSDAHSVFALEEPQWSQPTPAGLGRLPMAQMVNRLVAYDLKTGRITWQAGGARTPRDPLFSGQFFLGAPLALDDRLYVLSEDSGEIRLHCLLSAAGRPELVWSQGLLAPALPVPQHPLRRLTALSPTAGNGLLVSPTCAGAVVCFDPAARMLRWVYRYPDVVSSIQNGNLIQNRSAFQRGQEERPSWQDDTTLMAGDKVLLAPRDSDELHCLDLETGKARWTRERSDGLYLAGVYDGLALIVGRDSVWTVRLEDGGSGWQQPVAISIPAGRGLHLGNRYLLPLASGEMLTIDVKSGRILGRRQLQPDQTPGNLAAGGGRLVSLAADELLAFAPLADVEREILAGTELEPASAEALARRGELRLHRGDTDAAMQDLRDSLAVQADPQVKSVLASVMVEAFKADFEKHRSQAAEIEELTTPGPQREQFLRLLAEHLERREEPLEALKAYLRLADHTGLEDRLESLSSDWMVRGQRVLRGRIQSLVEGLNPDDRLVARQDLLQRLEGALASDNPAELPRWLRLLGGLSEAAPFATAAAERLIPDKDGLAWELAWLTQSLAQEPMVAGPATARLAAHFIETQRYGMAAPEIRRLATTFAEQVCREGLTGRQLADQWRALAPYQSEVEGPPPWSTGEAEVRRTQTPSILLTRRTTQLPVLSAVGALEGWTFEVDPMGMLVARDQRGVLQRRVAIPVEEGDSIPTGPFPGLMFLRTRGHFIVLVLPTHVAVFDASQEGAPQSLWTRSLIPRRHGGGAAAHLLRSRQGHQMMRNVPGEILAITEDSVIYGIGNELGAFDLRTGRTEWVRHDIGPWISSFVNDQTILLQTDEMVAEADGHTLRAIRASDGETLPDRRLPRGQEVIWVDGTRALLRKTIDAVGQQWSMIDLAADRSLWTRETPETGRPWLDPDRREILLVGTQGDLQAWSLADGRPNWSCQLPVKYPEGTAPTLFTQSLGDRLLVICGTDAMRDPDRRFLPEYPQQQISLNATAVMLNVRTRGVEWQTPLGRHSFDPWHPTGLPILVTTTRYMRLGSIGGSGQLGILMLDKRTGRKLYESHEGMQNMSYSVDGEPADREFRVRIATSELEVKFVEEAPADAEAK